MPQTKREKRIKALHVRSRELTELIDACRNLTDEDKKNYGYFPIHDRISKEIRNIKEKIGEFQYGTDTNVPVAVVTISA